jgi:hypothetical protein
MTVESAGIDSIHLICPSGKKALSGGFTTDNSLVLLNGDSPYGETGRTIEVSNLDDTESAVWTPYVNCI